MTSSPIQLKNEILLKIRKNKRVRDRLQLSLDRSYFSILRYIDSNDIILTSATALQIISEETGIPQDQLLKS